VLDGVHSQHSKRAYAKALSDFLLWWQSHGRQTISKALVQQYRAELESEGLAPASINLRLSAIRKLAIEAADNGLLAPEVAAGISRVRGIRSLGTRVGRWLTAGQANTLLGLPDRSTNKGKRDQVILAMLVGCGLRRNELAQLTFEHIQQRDGRWVLTDLIGKGRRIRTVAMPLWAKPVVDAWSQAVGTTAGPLLWRVNKSDVISAAGMTAQSIFSVVKGYGIDLRESIAPHDLRRTYAKLAKRGGASVEQIQFSLGHSSVLTTERYLGTQQDLVDAPCDHLGLTFNQE
jgi:site-specific recombinase XerD